MVSKIRVPLLIVSHLLVGTVGFSAGVYLLPILTAPAGPAPSEIQATASRALYTGRFRRELEDSDALHWGEGTVFVSKSSIALEGHLAPGPDYKLYLSPDFIETEAEFNRLKSAMVRVGDVETFENFVVAVPGSIDLAKFTSVVVWCETFGQFITAAKYR